MKRPRSSRLANRHMPCPSCHNTLSSPPRRPPEHEQDARQADHAERVSCTNSAKPSVKPLRIPVWPPANQIRAPLEAGIIAAACPSPAPFSSAPIPLKLRPSRKSAYAAGKLDLDDAAFSGSGSEGRFRLRFDHYRFEHRWNLRPLTKLLAPAEQLARVNPRCASNFGSNRAGLDRRGNNPLLLTP